jgi:DNA repair photolyase
MITRDLDSFVDGPNTKTMPDGVVEIECKHALSRSKLPGLDYALNPYVGCAHDCIYCYAPFLLNKTRESWRTPVGARTNLPRLLDSELRKATGTIGVGTVTDPYQPAEAVLELTRRCLDIAQRRGARISIHTKSDLVLRDIDMLKLLPKPEVGITLTTIDETLARTFEPFAPAPSARLKAMRSLVDAGIETYVLIGPIIPTVTDSDIEGLAREISSTGARRAMLDRLRLRPGMLDYLSGLEGLRTGPGKKFLDSMLDRDYCSAVERELANELRRNRIEVEQAF